ncbi:unnamed protein product [Ilex paraguariensis]|uniref:Dirigent protein n=1 Tax=Ilex paraguariensis TaxID=185542 RepID=A0ABC8U628_9AQUA
MNHEKEKMIKLHFYFHKQLDGKSLTGARVATANTTEGSPTTFGVFDVTDDPVTAEPKALPKLQVGRAYGLHSATSLEEGNREPILCH